MKLYIYDHCPYCVKARMIFGLKNIPVTLITLLNDDEGTPARMIGKKMVPILAKEEGSFMPESMDIVQYVDSHYGTSSIVQPAPEGASLSAWLEETRSYSSPLTMPRWANAPLEEFRTEGARNYFIRKKEAAIGSFTKHLENTPQLVEQAHAHLALLEPVIRSEEAVHGVITNDDFHLFALLRGLSIVKELSFPEKVEAYTVHMARKSGVPLYR